MRDKSEIGYLPQFGREVNEAYSLYASLYLDYVDDNLRHFFCRDVDIRPIRALDHDDECAVADAYIKSAMGIAKFAVDNMTDLEIMAFFSNYPDLRGKIDLPA